MLQYLTSAHERAGGTVNPSLEMAGEGLIILFSAAKIILFSEITKLIGRKNVIRGQIDEILQYGVAFLSQYFVVFEPKISNQYLIILYSRAKHLTLPPNKIQTKIFSNLQRLLQVI